MTSDELLTLFRSDVVDDVAPYLWSDAEIFAYMNDAYFMFVRLTGGISDYTSTVTQVVAQQGERFAEIDPSILNIRTASVLPDYRELKIINAQATSGIMSDDYGLSTNISANTQGRVSHMVIGQEPGLVQWIQIPDQDYTVKLLVERLPLEVIEGSNQDFTGVEAHHHFHFLKWMRHLAYRKQDADTFDLAKSEMERAEFSQYCSLAQQEKMRQRHKVRVVSYGGI